MMWKPLGSNKKRRSVIQKKYFVDLLNVGCHDKKQKTKSQQLSLAAG